MHLGIDLGTGSVKVLALTPDGVEKSISRDYPVLSLHPGYAETPVAEWINAIRSALSELGPFTGYTTVGFSGQMHGVVPCAGGEAIHPAILWNDTRSVPQDYNLDDSDPEQSRRLMNRPSAGMALLSILWLKKNRKEIYDKTEVFLQPKDFIRYYLTGEAATDPSDAGATLLFDFVQKNWYQDLLLKYGIDSQKLPPIKESFSRAAPILPNLALEIGLPSDTEVRIGGADTACALLGNGIFDNKILQLSIGTGAQIISFNQKLPSYSSKLNTVPTVDGQSFRMAAHLNGGTFLEWLRRIIGFTWEDIYDILQSRSLEIWLSELQDLIFLPYINGERTPLMDADLSGNISGLKSTHTKNHIILAAMLGTLFAIRSGMDFICKEDSIPFDIPLLATGGSFSHTWWAQLTATVLKHPLSISERLNASAYGAALIGSGKDSTFYKRFSVPSKGKVIEPDYSLSPYIDEMYGRFYHLSLSLQT